MTLKLTSTAFAHNSDIPEKYTCQGNDDSPPLQIADVPKEAKSLVLICEDPDAPDPAEPKMVWDHWVLFNISPDTTEIPEGSSAGTSGLNSWDREGYGGPCPPTGKHRYFFTLYALNVTLDLDETATKTDVKQAMEGHVIEKAELIGTYEKH